MTADDKKSVMYRLAAGRLRRLFFDTLEDRRLMAGLEVYVFEDLNSSRTFDVATDGGALARAVYIDLNNDAKYSSNEPLAISNDQGIASFADLGQGDYSIRLLGSNKSVVQTFPIQPASQGTWVDGFSLSKIVSVTPSGMAWGISGSSLSLVDPALGHTAKSIRFGTSTVLDAVLKPADDGEMSGYVLTEGQDEMQVLWHVSTAGNGTKRAVSVELSNATQLISVEDSVFVVHGTNTKEISKFDFSLGVNGPNLVSTGVGGLPANSVLKSNGLDSFLVFSDGDSSDASVAALKPSALAFYEIKNGEVQLVGSRSFASKVLSWDVAKDGSGIAVATADGVSVLQPQVDLPIRKVIENAVSPVVFDPVNGVLITGDASSASKLVAWRTTDWSQTISIPISKTKQIVSTASLSMDASGSQIVLSQDGSLYQHNVAAPAAATVKLEGNELKRVYVGVKSSLTNTKPTLGSLGGLVVDEDAQLNFDGVKLQSNATDLDGDGVFFVLRSGPANGALVWNEDGTGIYSPGTNWNGQDAIEIQAYDGRDWSSIQVLPIEVHPMNDLPMGVDFSDTLVPENSPFLTSYGTLKVLDADSDAQYEYLTSDDRFSVVDGTIRLVKGSVDFEEEPVIILAVTAFERSRPQDTFTKTITLRIQDENDAPSGISSPSAIVVPELVEDMDIAKLTVIDQDASDIYEWSVSDSRFTVDGGILHLAAGQSLDFENEPLVSLIVKAVDSRGGFSIEKPLTIRVTNQDDEPSSLVITSSGRITENVVGAVVGQVTVLDADQGEQYTYSVSDSRFEVTAGGVLKLRVGASVSYTAPGIIDLSVFATSLRTSARISGSLRLLVQKDPTPYHNDLNPYDVDGDGTLTPLDPLIIINHINNNGIGPIEAPGEGEGPLPDLDVDGDGVVSPIDILILINKLNQQADENKHSMGDFSSGEGEGANIAAVTSSPTGSAVVGSYANNDLSLASYLADFADDTSVRKSKRR